MFGPGGAFITPEGSTLNAPLRGWLVSSIMALNTTPDFGLEEFIFMDSPVVLFHSPYILYLIEHNDIVHLECCLIRYVFAVYFLLLAVKSNCPSVIIKIPCTLYLGMYRRIVMKDMSTNTVIASAGFGLHIQYSHSNSKQYIKQSNPPGGLVGRGPGWAPCAVKKTMDVGWGGDQWL